jgi:hypothetical protein
MSTSLIRNESSYKQLEVKTNRASLIRHESSYKQLEVKTNRTSLIRHESSDLALNNTHSLTSFLRRCFLSSVTSKQELLTLPEHLTSPPGFIFGGVGKDEPNIVCIWNS